MDTYKIYRNNKVVSVSATEYKQWLADSAALYFVGPTVTEDGREVYTAFTANSLNSSCFTTFEVYLDENGMSDTEYMYDSPDWVTARDLHKRLLKAKKERNVLAHHHM